MPFTGAEMQSGATAVICSVKTGATAGVSVVARVRPPVVRASARARRRGVARPITVKMHAPQEKYPQTEESPNRISIRTLGRRAIMVDKPAEFPAEKE